MDGIDLDAVAALPRIADHTVDPAALWSALTTLDGSSLDDHDTLESLVAWQRLESAAAAHRLAGYARFRTLPVGRRPADSGPVTHRACAADEIALRLGASPRTTQRLMDVADTLDEQLPTTQAACQRGLIDVTKATVLAEAVIGLLPSACGEIERDVVQDAVELNPARLRRRAQRAALAANPNTTEDRRQRARERRFVIGMPGHDGMADLQAHLPALDWLAIDTAINAAARGLKAGGDQRSMDQLRADALAAPFYQALTTGILDGLDPLPLAGHRGRPVQLEVAVPLAVLLGLSEEPAELRGYGPISAAMARELAADADWRRILTGPAGEVVAVDPRRYSPPTSLARLIETRDGTCRFPGCGTKARHCDLDHTIPFPEGATAATNLGALCRRHHRMKHEALGVTLEQQKHGRFTWTMPTGQQYAVNPEEDSTPPDARPAQPSPKKRRRPPTNGRGPSYP